MGTGADVAIESAGMTLVKGDLRALVRARRLSKATMRNIRQNLFFAFAYNVLGIPLAAMGLLNPIIAGGAMAMSSLSVVSNALLLKQWRPGYRKNEPKPMDAVEATSDIGEQTQQGAKS